MEEMTQANMTQKLMSTKLYEDLEPGKYVVKVDSIEEMTFDNAKGTYTKYRVNTTVQSGGNGRGKSKKVRAEYLVDFKAKEGVDAKDVAGSFTAVEIGTRGLRKLSAACGWYTPEDGKKAVAKVEQGLARFMDSSFDVKTSLNGAQFLAVVAKTKDGKYTEIKDTKEITESDIGSVAAASAQ